MTEADLNNEYAYWTAPGDRFTVTYSLGVFHEIDFQVSEGFRRIPHGGIETGGLLFGRLAEQDSQLSARIEAFRTIECEHASGPSFNLSERDIAGIREQLAAASSDPELQGLQPLGWFVAHTRSPLEMNDREAALFAELFPGPGRLLLLVKPERFQATRFAFILRGTDGRFERDAAASAIILPLPGRAGRSTQGPAASIPAPISGPPPQPARAVTPAPPPVPPKPVTPPPAAPAASSAPSFWSDVPISPKGREPIVKIEEPPPLAELSKTTALAPKQPARDEIGHTPDSIATAEPDWVHGEPQRITRKMGRSGRLSGLRLAALLLLAAGLGCGVGYFAYLQLPSATIPLSIERTPAAATSASGSGQLVLSWPADETRDAIYASVRVDEGEGVPLSTQQKESGHVSLPVSGDNMKIELIAHRRWRDSRGIIRYVRAKSLTP